MSLRADELALRHELDKRRARKSFLHFCLYVSPQFATNWHIEEIARAVDDIVFGDLRRLYVAMPPQIGKSTLMSVHFPAFMLGVRPDCRIMGASYAIKLASHFNREVQTLISSERYKELFPDTVLRPMGAITQDMSERTQSVFRLVNKRGGLRSFGTEGSATGFSADCAIVDDAHRNAKDADSEKKREAVQSFFRGTLTPRLQQNGILIVIGTRWNERDFLSMMLEQASRPNQRSPWRVISYPAIKETPPSKEDPREIGEALWPARFTIEELLERKVIIGTREFNALYQQRPAPMDGSIVKISWFKTYTAADLPEFESQVISADLTFSDKGDYCVITVWGVSGADAYLLDMDRQRVPFVKQLQRFSSMCQKWPAAEKKLVEQAANGEALKSTLEHTIPGIDLRPARQNKLLRLSAVAPRIESGNVYIPTKNDAPWLDDFLEEFRSFPNGQHDDIVDSTSQALAYIKDNTFSSDFTPVSIQRTSPFAGELIF